MKKLLVSLLTLVMLTVSLSACTAAKVYKYGVGTVIDVTASDFVPAVDTTAAKDGKYGVNVDIVSVVLDSKGKVVSCTWDIAQTSNLKFNDLGVHTTDLATYVLKTKLEKGADYGMKGASAIGKEWFEQSAFLTTYVVGKTAEEVAAIAVNDAGEATSTDILAGTTIGIDSFKAAFAKAVANATETKAVAKYGVAAIIGVTASDYVPAVDTTAAKDGKYGVNVDVIKVTLDKDGKILNVIWDIAQTSNLKFNNVGVHTTDLATYSLKTKLEKGADYGMKGASAIGKEWFEQSAFLSNYVVGMTLDQVKAIAMNDAGEATSTDILAGTTIGIETFVAALEKAMTSAVAVK